MTTTSSTTKNFIVPWPCMIDHPDPPIAENPSFTSTPNGVTVTKNQQKTFAQALSNVCDVPLSQLPQPIKKGNQVAIEIPEEEYFVGLDECKHNLHGRILWPKGSSPVSLENLRVKLAILWKSLGKWGISSIGRGFYEFTFSSIEDLRRVRSVGSWALNPGMLKLFAWSKDFSPTMQQQTTAQVWIRIFGLSQEYWRQRILFAIASGVGTPICTDSITSKPRIERVFGHYARVLVDLSLAQDLVHRILVERKGFAFFVDIEYENLPDFCTHCQSTGHHIEICKRMRDFTKGVPQNKQGKAKVPDKTYVPKKPEVVNVESSATKDVERSKEDIALENEINESIEAHNAAIDLISENRILIPDEPVIVEQVIREDESEFVDNTQSHADLEGDSQSTASVHSKAILVQKDIDFLKDSWANLAELNVPSVSQDLPVLHVTTAGEIAQQIHSPVISPVAVDDEGFQQVLTKQTKKNQKAALMKSTYSTRSKVVRTKPLK